MGTIEEKVKNSFKDIINALQMAKLYGTNHPKFKTSVDKAYTGVQEPLKDKNELTLGIINEELIFEKEIFFDFSKTIKPAIDYLKERGIEKLVFKRDILKEELEKFLIFLAGSKDTTKAPQEHLSSIGIKNITAGKIGFSEESLSSKTAVGNTYGDSLDKLSKTIGMVLNNETIDYLSLKFTVNNLLDALLNQYQEILKLTTTVKKYDFGTFMHCLNVSILSIYLSSKIGFSKDECMETGIAALLHDIGKLTISRKIIAKPDRLSDEEFGKIKSHCSLGAWILLKYTDTLGILPVVVAFEHHLKYDSTGYPKLSSPRKPNIVTMIVTICDVYDALCQRRNYKNDYPPDIIYKIMMKEKAKAFEPYLLDNFFKIMGVWPVGSIVSLTDNRIAVVREQNANDISLPKVEIIAGQYKKELLDLKDSQGKIEIDHYLNPYSEGKPYLALI